MKLAAVVLAGGAGERFGGAKLAAPLGGRPLLAFALDAAAAAAADIIVVAGPNLAELALAWSRCAGREVRMVAAPDEGEGMGASLRVGLAAARAGVDGVFVFLGDMPFVPLAIPRKLADALAGGVAAAAPAHRGRRGHPVLLGLRLIAQRARIGGDRGAADLLAIETGLVLIDTDDDGVVFDVDTPDDLAEAVRRLAQAGSPSA